VRGNLGLRLGDPYEYAFVSLALRVDLSDGTHGVLKIGFPHRESAHEADALAHYGGRGAIRLLDHDPDRGALLLERCEPGTTLLEGTDEVGSLPIAARSSPGSGALQVPAILFAPSRRMRIGGCERCPLAGSSWVGRSSAASSTNSLQPS
jgi:hypothetical protein